MKKCWFIVLLLCFMVAVRGGYAATNTPDQKAKATAATESKDKGEEGKKRKMSLHKISKSGDPELIYSTAINLYEQKKWSKAAQMFDACQGYYVGSAKEDSIAFFSARSRFKHREYHDASIQLDEFRRKFGRSAFLEDAEAMFAMCQYYLTPGPTRDQSVTSEAIISFSEYIARYPNSKRVEAFQGIIEELTSRLKDKAYINAFTYYKIQKYKSAVVALRNALKLFPETPHRESILYYIVVSNYRLAHNSIESKQTERYLSLLDSYYSFIEEFPDSKHRKEVERYVKEAKNYIDKNNIENQR